MNKATECPYNEPLHNHHDGCPSCYYEANKLTEGDNTMSKIRAILNVLKIDKLLTMDILELGAMYLTVAFHLVMIAFIVWLFKWFLYVSC